MIKDDDHQDYHALGLALGGENRHSQHIEHQVLEDELHFISILKAPKMRNQQRF